MLNLWPHLVGLDKDLYTIRNRVVTIESSKEAVVPAAKQHSGQQAIDNSRAVKIAHLFAELCDGFLILSFEPKRD